jgi:glycolate oxidase
MIEQRHIDALKKIAGSEDVKTDKPHLRAYSYDATKEHYEPEAVVFPENEEEVSKILKYCNDNKIFVVPRGAGSGFTGGALPVNGGIILALEKYMNKIIEIDGKDMVAVVQPGVINADLQKAVKAKGLFYPPDPASMDYSTIGGNVSENAGGMRAAKYGLTKDYVMCLRAVLPNGEIIRAGKRTIKDVAGYNVAGILIANEGTLAVITEITMKLLPKPKLKKTYMGVFENVEQAMNAVYKSLAGGAMPVAMEFMDSLVVKALREKLGVNLPEWAGALLVGDVDGNVMEEIDYQLEILEKSFKEEGAKEFKIAANDEEANEIWYARRNASPSITMYGTKKINEDISVPRSKLPDALNGIYAIAEKYSVLAPCFGHAGDGNIHVNVMVNADDADEVKRGYQAVEEIFKFVVELEGTLSGEHGIGLSKAPFMEMAFSEAELNLFRKIKHAFDPNGILNPGKMGL